MVLKMVRDILMTNERVGRSLIAAVVCSEQPRYFWPMSPTTRIALWSGPRNISTAMMYSFAQRADTGIVDEPLFGHFLTHTGVDRPSRYEVMATMELDGQKVILEELLAPCDEPVYFMKHIANHLVGLDWGFLRQFKNVLLIRHPRDVIASYIKNVERPSMLDVAYEVQNRLLDHLLAEELQTIVIDSKRVLLDPEGQLKRLCKELDIAFDPAMLYWEAGARVEDGVWAKYWYHSVHKSTGFAPYKEKKEELPDDLLPLYEECLPHYERILKYAI